MSDWNIQSRSHQCHACEQSFEDGVSYHTVLAYENSEYLRHDICEACWNGESEGVTDRKGFISHWQGTYEAPPPAPPDAIQKDNAEGLLRKLVETGDERWREASYILAVMLERKRVLKVKEQIQEKNGRAFVYELPHTGDIFTISDPDLKMEELEQVQIEVAALLEHGLPVEGEEWPPLPPDPEAGPEPPVGQKEESTEEETAEVEMTP
ncbi:uncharacterized protein METZ01_LOCUS457533 [marine metagenome]|uniref:Uncharacterized protein n=1 Tax=marine metagenome TaxID=408172 RepID=A0A383AAU0_9ZZZZ